MRACAIRSTLLALVVGLTTTAMPLRARPAATQPSTQPATTTAAQRPLTLYASIFGQGGRPCWTGETIDNVPALQGVHPDFIDASARLAKNLNVGLVVDYEGPLTPGAGIATTRDLATLTKLDTYVREMTRMLRQARAAAGIDQDDPAHRRLVVAYVGLPIGAGFQYDTDQAQFVADNKRVAAADPLRDADALAMDAYLWYDDVKGMNAVAIRRFTGRKLAAARLFGKPIVMFIMPTYVNHSPEVDVPDELLQALLAVARDERLDVCVWKDNCDAPTTKRYMDRITAAARAVDYR